MYLAQYKLKNNVLLAPMAGVTDRPFRQMCYRLGAGMAVSEMLSSNLMCGNLKNRSSAWITMESVALDQSDCGVRP